MGIVQQESLSQRSADENLDLAGLLLWSACVRPWVRVLEPQSKIKSEKTLWFRDGWKAMDLGMEGCCQLQGLWISPVPTAMNFILFLCRPRLILSIGSTTQRSLCPQISRETRSVIWRENNRRKFKMRRKIQKESGKISNNLWFVILPKSVSTLKITTILTVELAQLVEVPDT